MICLAVWRRCSRQCSCRSRLMASGTLDAWCMGKSTTSEAAFARDSRRWRRTGSPCKRSTWARRRFPRRSLRSSCAIFRIDSRWKSTTCSRIIAIISRTRACISSRARIFHRSLLGCLRRFSTRQWGRWLSHSSIRCSNPLWMQAGNPRCSPRNSKEPITSKRCSETNRIMERGRKISSQSFQPAKTPLRNWWIS